MSDQVFYFHRQECCEGNLVSWRKCSFIEKLFQAPSRPWHSKADEGRVLNDRFVGYSERQIRRLLCFFLCQGRRYPATWHWMRTWSIESNETWVSENGLMPDSGGVTLQKRTTFCCGVFFNISCSLSLGHFQLMKQKLGDYTLHLSWKAVTNLANTGIICRSNCRLRH